MRAARVEVDLDAVRHNVRTVAATVAPAAVCFVVKADGYGHGSIAVARAGLEAGASWLAVALVEEAAVLREAGISSPILLLSEPKLEDVGLAVHHGLRLSVYRHETIEAAADMDTSRSAPVPLHLKVNTGMNRIGAAPEDVVGLAQAIARRPGVKLEALWTHCAVADEPGNEFTQVQLGRFDAVVSRLERAGIQPPILHVANSAAAIDHPSSHHDMVRVGIAAYGIAPSPALQGRLPLRPAMSLLAEVSLVKRVAAGESISYGLTHRFERPATVATVPIGYADGVARNLSRVGGEVLIRGRRYPIVGRITMDQLMVDCGDEVVDPGDEVVLIGEQGSDQITADEWAARLDTIAYEIVCGIGPRVPRCYQDRC